MLAISRLATANAALSVGKRSARARTVSTSENLVEESKLLEGASLRVVLVNKRGSHLMAEAEIMVHERMWDRFMYLRGSYTPLGGTTESTRTNKVCDMVTMLCHISLYFVATAKILPMTVTLDLLRHSA